ncbi:MAG: hypothetical protein N2114_05135, partial [Candidatus Goldbacteria bacterium]|nr:hypothetical protein [Candidatus Goldiibacteriota bacterium]
DPYKFQGKKIIAKKLILLKGEKKENFLFLYFFIRFEKKDFYLIIQSDNKILNDIEDFKIGYYYDVEFRSTKGKFNEGNIAISIKPTGDKTDWASGVNAF